MYLELPFRNNNIYKSFYLIITTFVLILSILSYVLNIYNYLSIFVFVLNLIFIFKFKNKIPIFLFFIYNLLHSNVFIYYFNFNLQISFWPDFQNDSSMAKVLIVHLLFIYTVGTLLKPNKRMISDHFKFITKNKYIYIVIFLFSILFLQFGITGDNIFTSGMYNTGDLVKSSIHEYFILLFIVSLFFIPNLLFFRLSQLVLLIAYVLKTLIYGGRIEALELLLVYFYFYFILLNKIKLKYIYLSIIIGIYLMLVISNIRDNPSKLLSNNYLDLLNILDFNFLHSKNVINSTEGDVIQSSSRIIGLIENGSISNLQRFFGFPLFVLSVFVPNHYLPAYSNLATFLQDRYTSGGGGMISTYFYCWLGYSGPILIGIFLSFVINKFYDFKSKYYFIYGLAIITTFPRWFSYNPIFIVKFCFFTLLAYFFALKISKLRL